MSIRTFMQPITVLVIGLLMLQTGCEQAELARIKQEKVAENLSTIRNAADRHLSKLNADASDSKASTAATEALTPQDSPSSNQDSLDSDEQASQPQTDPAKTDPQENKESKLAEPTIEITDNWTQLSKDREVWIDKKAKQVMFSGRVCLNQGQLEMFICPAGTKEHESVIASNALSSEVHMALLLVDCKPGKATAWDPAYRPAHGPTIDATIKWRDEKSGETKSQNAKQWIRDVDTEKAMTQRWIFGGSAFWKDPDSGEEVYYGDSGELICLSNFSTATIDVDVKSSQANDGLLFEAFTENIPPVGTKVYTVITPGEIVKPEVKPETKEKAEPLDAKKADPKLSQEVESEMKPEK